jgi:molecular chaperone DnaK
VLQGERELVKDCRSLGEFTLAGIPPMPAGLPKIRVTFLIDASGILNVMAVEERSNTKASVQIVPSYGLAKTEVDQMVRESVRHAREDMLEHRLIDLRNQIRQDVAAIEKSLAIVGGDIEVGYRAEMLGAIEKLRGLESSKDADAIHAALTEMDKKSARLGEMAVTKTLRETT